MAVRQPEVLIVHNRLVADVAELVLTVAVLADNRVVAALLLVDFLAFRASSAVFDVDVRVVVQT